MTNEITPKKNVNVAVTSEARMDIGWVQDLKVFWEVLQLGWAFVILVLLVCLPFVIFQVGLLCLFFFLNWLLS